MTTQETYQQQKQRHAKEFGNFEGIFFAFSASQLEEGLLKVQATSKEIVSIGMGGFLRKDKVGLFDKLIERQAKERKELRANEKELVNAIAYELANHEYCITGDPQDALDALGLSIKELAPEVLKKAIKKHNETNFEIA